MLEVIVVDSASQDDTVARTRARFPQVVLIPQSENVGYTRGNNIGLALAQGKYLLLLNPDTVLEPTTLAHLCAVLDTRLEVGIVGPHTLNSDGTHQSTRRRFPSLPLMFFESTWIESRAPRSWLMRYAAKDQPDDGVFEVDWVQGHCLMARREVYDRLGGLDEGFVMYCEELDWCRRAKDAGWHVLYVGTTRMTHHSGQSSAQIGARKHIHFNTSKVRYAAKVYGRWSSGVLRMWLLAGFTWQIVLEGLKAALGNQRAMRRERIGIYQQVLRSGLRSQ